MMTKLVARASLGLCSGPSGQGFDSLVVRLTIIWNISYIMHLTKIFIHHSFANITIMSWMVIEHEPWASRIVRIALVPQKFFQE